MTNSDFSRAFEEHKDAVFGFAYRMTGSTHVAEDVAQDCFLVLLDGAASYDAARGGLRCFLFGVACNLIFKRWRAEGRWDVLEEPEVAVEPVDLVSLETADLVAQAVGALPPLQREALILAEYEGLSLKEIVVAVASEVGAVKARLHRARENLRHTLAPLARTAGVDAEAEFLMGAADHAESLLP